MASRILIVGGVAGGATAAARLSRLNRALQVTMLERSPDVSFANCGLPYYIGGEIKEHLAFECSQTRKPTKSTDPPAR